MQKNYHEKWMDRYCTEYLLSTEVVIFLFQDMVEMDRIYKTRNFCKLNKICHDTYLCIVIIW